MARVTWVSLADHLEAALLRALKARAVEQTGRTPLPVPVPADPDEALFEDHDAAMRRAGGYFSYDETERRTRRIDLRTPYDRDPGPIPMEEASPGEDAIELHFGR